MKKTILALLVLGLFTHGVLARENRAAAALTKNITAEVEGETVNKEVELIRTPPNYALGGTFGLLAGATSLSGEIRFPLPYTFRGLDSAGRLALGLAQSSDQSRRYVPVQFDVMLKFPAGIITGVENYLGAGLNYVAYTSGGTAGSLGGEAFYGVESTGFHGKLFGEMGWGMLCTGRSPSQQGLTILVGYRK